MCGEKAFPLFLKFLAITLRLVYFVLYLVKQLKDMVFISISQQNVSFLLAKYIIDI